MARVYVLHENPLWLPPLAQAFDKGNLPWTEWFLDKGAFDLSSPPPEGVFYSRMSASSHTRNHRYSAELTVGILAWLKSWGRRVINGSSALDLEISKIRQYAELQRHGIVTPRTVFITGRDEIVPAYERYFSGQRVILKPNRGGRGEGVQLFESSETLEKYVESEDYETPIDGLQLLQEYIVAPKKVITRAEFIGGRFVYAVEVDTTEGFQLCPCENKRDVSENPREKFRIIGGIPEQLRTELEKFLDASAIDVAGIEFITDTTGRNFVYDINTNTNYNSDAEESSGRAGTERSGPGALAAFLHAELARLPKTV